MREFHSLYELQLFWDRKKHAISFSPIVGYFKAFFISFFFQIQRRISFAGVSFCFHLAYLSKGIVNDLTCEWKKSNDIHCESKKCQCRTGSMQVNKFLCLSILLPLASKNSNQIWLSHRKDDKHLLWHCIFSQTDIPPYVQFFFMHCEFCFRHLPHCWRGKMRNVPRLTKFFDPVSHE